MRNNQEHQQIINFLSDMARQKNMAIDDILTSIFKSAYGETYEKWLLANSAKPQVLKIDIVSKLSSEIEKILKYVVKSVSLYLPATAGSSIVLWNAQAQDFTLSMSSVPGQPPQITAKRIRRKNGATRWIIDHQEMLIVNNVREDPFSANSMLGEYDIKSYLGIPLLNGNQAIGVLYALNYKIYDFTERDIHFMKDLGEVAAATIAQTILTEQLFVANTDLHAYTHMVAHDLKSPISTLYGFAQLAREEEDVSESLIKSYLDKIIQAIRQTFIIIDNLLLLADLKTKKEIFTYRIDVRSLIADIQLKLHDEIQNLNGDLLYPAETLKINGNPIWLNALLTNLIRYALQYGAPSPVIKVGYAQLSDNKVNLWVQANALPIQQSVLFDPITEYTDLQMAGDKLELVLVKRIVDKLEGVVGTEHSDTGENTIFVILPQNIGETDSQRFFKD